MRSSHYDHAARWYSQIHHQQQCDEPLENKRCERCSINHRFRFSLLESVLVTELSSEVSQLSNSYGRIGNCYDRSISSRLNSYQVKRAVSIARRCCNHERPGTQDCANLDIQT